MLHPVPPGVCQPGMRLGETCGVKTARQRNLGFRAGLEHGVCQHPTAVAASAVLSRYPPSPHPSKQVHQRRRLQFTANRQRRVGFVEALRLAREGERLLDALRFERLADKKCRRRGRRGALRVAR